MKTEELSSPDKSESPTRKAVRSKRKIPRICGIKVKTSWKIRRQFMSAIYILNGIFLLLIIIIIMVNMVGVRLMTFQFTEVKLQDNQEKILNNFAIELAESLASKLSYYFQVGNLYGRLITDMLYQHTDTKIFNSYPLNQPNSSTIPNLTEWGYSATAGVNSNLQEYYKATLKALNYFADELMTTYDGIPLQAVYAAFFDSTGLVYLSLGYPKTAPFEKPSYLGDNWYTRALISSTDKAFDYKVSNGTVRMQFSHEIYRPDNTPLCVVLVEILADNFTTTLLDRFYTISQGYYKTLVVDEAGNIVAASSALGLSPVTTSGTVPLINNTNLGITTDVWNSLVSQMLLENATILSFTNPAGEVIYATGNKIRLDMDISLYAVVLFPETIAMNPINDLETDIINQAIPTVIIVLIVLLLLFIIFFTFTVRRASQFIDPFTTISNYAERKIDQITNPESNNREIEPIQLIEGEDEIGEFVTQFKKMISGLSAIKNETQETIPKFEDDKYEYPRNYMKGKFLPWRNSFHLLQSKEAVIVGNEVVKEKKQAGGMKLNLIKKKY